MHGLQNTARLLLTMHSNMKIVITDYPKVLSRDLQYEKNRITAVLEDAEITVEEIAALAGTFNYEFVCDLGKRIPRNYYLNGQYIGSHDYFHENWKLITD